MSRKTFSINYKESQIIKHSLQNMIADKKKAASYGFASTKDIEEEERLLKRVTEFVDEYKKYIRLDKEPSKKKWDCKAIMCPDRTGKLEEICERCGVYTNRHIHCPMTWCEAFPNECNKDSIHCKRCEGYIDCY